MTATNAPNLSARLPYADAGIPFKSAFDPTETLVRRQN
jgi:hypothetical protein